MAVAWSSTAPGASGAPGVTDQWFLAKLTNGIGSRSPIPLVVPPPLAMKCGCQAFANPAWPSFSRPRGRG